jgi:hypothetical protein
MEDNARYAWRRAQTREMCTYHEVDLLARVPLLDVHHGILNAIKIEVQRTGGLERACPMSAPILTVGEAA